MRAALVLLAWGITLHLLNAFYAGVIADRQSQINDLTVKQAAMAEENARLIQQRDAAVYLAKRFQRGQCSI